MATPEGYRFDEPALAWIRQQVPELDLTVTADPVEAVRDAGGRLHRRLGEHGPGVGAGGAAAATSPPTRSTPS